MSAKSRERRERWAKVQEAQEIEGLVRRARFYDLALLNTDIEVSSKLNRLKPYTIVADVQNVSDSVPIGTSFSIGELRLKLPFPIMFLEWQTGWKNGVLSIELLQDTPMFEESRKKFDCYCANIIVNQIFMTSDGMPYPVGVQYMRLDEEYIQQESITFTTKNRPDALLSFDADPRDYFDMIGAMAMYAVGIMNCRNVSFTDCVPLIDDSAAYERHFGVPLTKYKTLAIKSMSKRAASDQPQQQFDVIPLHLRRGNFAHYTEDAPLFGKFTGTFWRPATVVGSEKNGIVVKDYKVLVPEA